MARRKRPLASEEQLAREIDDYWEKSPDGMDLETVRAMAQEFVDFWRRRRPPDPFPPDLTDEERVRFAEEQLDRMRQERPLSPADRERFRVLKLAWDVVKDTGDHHLLVLLDQALRIEEGICFLVPEGVIDPPLEQIDVYTAGTPPSGFLVSPVRSWRFSRPDEPQRPQRGRPPENSPSLEERKRARAWYWEQIWAYMRAAAPADTSLVRELHPNRGIQRKWVRQGAQSGAPSPWGRTVLLRLTLLDEEREVGVRLAKLKLWAQDFGQLALPLAQDLPASTTHARLEVFPAHIRPLRWAVWREDLELGKAPDKVERVKGLIRTVAKYADGQHRIGTAAQPLHLVCHLLNRGHLGLKGLPIGHVAQRVFALPDPLTHKDRARREWGVVVDHLDAADRLMQVVA